MKETVFTVNGVELISKKEKYPAIPFVIESNDEYYLAYWDGDAGGYGLVCLNDGNSVEEYKDSLDDLFKVVFNDKEYLILSTNLSIDGDYIVEEQAK